MLRVVPSLLLISMGLFGLSGEVAAQGMNRVYELRTYATHPDRLDALIQRFEDHAIRLFEKHGIENVGYWVPQDAASESDGPIVEQVVRVFMDPTVFSELR